MITGQHFGGNIVLTRDNLTNGEPFRETLREIEFAKLRYPGGGVTEDQTWENGGLQRMFGDPVEPGTENYVLTLREVLAFAQGENKSISLVTPVFQFYNKSSGNFDEKGFARYLTELEAAIKDYPDVHIEDVEIGNEYWGSKQWGSLTATQYGQIANLQIPILAEMTNRLKSGIPGWEVPDIGVQAGVQWRAEQNPDGTWTAVGPRDSADIIAEISMDNRALVGSIVQHTYPDANDLAAKINWAIRPMEVFSSSEGFRDDLKFLISEYNIGENTAVGIEQGAAWIEGLSRLVSQGVDSIDHWGISYKWLSNKFYDIKFPPAESLDGQIVAIATPMGQMYDIAQSHLIGKEPVSDEEALRGIKVPNGAGVTGFADVGQRVVFLHNTTGKPMTIGFDDIPPGMHVSARLLTPADSPHSPWYDESMPTAPKDGEIADARADMKVLSGDALGSQVELDPREMVVIVISDPHRDLVIEGAHNLTDPTTGMVNDVIVGARGNDILRGHVGDDLIKGGGGRNVLSGGRGSDILIAGDRGDVIFADGGHDEVHGGDGGDLIFFGSGAADGVAVITGGKGDDLFLLGAGKGVVITDLGQNDMLGFQGAFANMDALRQAMTVEGNDLLIDMPEGGQVVLVDRADMQTQLHGRLLDFLPPKSIMAVTDSYLRGLSDAQIREVFAQKEWGFDLAAPDNSPNYFSSLQATLDRLGVPEPDTEVPDVSDPELPTVDAPSQPENEDDEGEDEDVNDPLSSGAACFVATAAYGDRLHPDVVALRFFRDRHLVRWRAGRSFIKFYWRWGPRLAALTRPEQFHASLFRIALSIVVRAIMFLRFVRQDELASFRLRNSSKEV